MMECSSWREGESGRAAHFHSREAVNSLVRPVLVISSATGAPRRVEPIADTMLDC